jgi:hypothetical protein
MRWQPIVSGVLGLALLEASLSSPAAAGRVGQLLDGIASVIAHVLSPAVPAIPDLRQRGGAATSSAPLDPAPGKPSSPTFPADWDTSPSSLFV